MIDFANCAFILRTVQLIGAVSLASALASCGGGGSGTNTSAPPAAAYTIGGTVSGLHGTVVLQNNGAGDLSVSANGAFTFGGTLGAGDSYSVTVLTQPDGEMCSVNGGAGTTSGHVTNVRVICANAVLAALPVLRIDTENGVDITSKEVYVNATLQLLDETGRVLLDNAPLEIRGRGNSTWSYDKKPYRVKLGSKAALLGMPASRHWVLLANYLDKTLLRNEIAFEFSRQTRLEYTPRSAQVVLELNGGYQGIYQLTEQIRIDPDRVDVPELKQTDGADPYAVTGGYLMEVDYWRGENYCRHTNRGVWLCFSNPETLLDADWASHRSYIDGYIDATESALYGPDFADPAVGYAAYINVDSAVDFYLVHELAKNVDSNFFSSVFLYKKRGGKLTFGPVWDFDLAFGNAQWGEYGFYDGSDPTGWHTRKQDNRTSDTGTSWYTRLFEDPAFEERVRARWAQLRAAGTIAELFEYIDRRAVNLGQVQQANFVRWPILNVVLPPDLSPVVGPYEMHVEAMRAWLQKRVEWIDAQLLP